MPTKLPTPAKRFIARLLLETCQKAPWTRPLLRKWGVRTSQEWFGDRVVDVQLPGAANLKLAGLSRNYLTFELFWRGADYYEPITALVMRQLVRPGDTFLDVGANVGWYSLLLSRFHPGLKIVAFEPNPNLAKLLKTNVRLNNFENIECEPFAVSDTEGEAVLHLSASDMSASLESDFDQKPSGSLVVQTTTVDRYLATHPVSGHLVVKVDVEGHEKALFRGAAETWLTRKPDIVCEVTGRMNGKPLDVLKSAGYRFYQITNEGLLPAEGFSLVVKGPFLFLNYLLTVRPEREVAAIFQRIQEQVRRIDLFETSKFVAPSMIQNLLARDKANDAAGPDPGLSGSRREAVV